MPISLSHLPKKSSVFGALHLLLASFGCIHLAHAQSSEKYPQRPVRLIVPYGPGGATDIVARQLALRLSENWGSQVIVDNRAGGSGTIALESVAHASTDGYTLMVGNVSTNAITESAFAKTLSIKPSRDLASITNLIEIPHMLLINASIPVNTIKQLVEYAKTATGLAYASAGIGSYPHLDGARLAKVMGVDMTHIPYKGGAGQIIPAMISNEVQLTMINLASAMPHIKNGRLKPMATTWPTRRTEFPDIPTMTEAGFNGIGTNAWNGLFGPAKMSPALINQIYSSAIKAMESSSVKESLAKQLIYVVTSTSPAQYVQFVNDEVTKWSAVIRENNIVME
jgi:tripartite-type tricarboxylate transporter receptor subunit TctC